MSRETQVQLCITAAALLQKAKDEIQSNFEDGVMFGDKKWRDQELDALKPFEKIIAQATKEIKDADHRKVMMQEVKNKL